MHVERVLREYGQLLRPMNEAPRDGKRILGHHPRTRRLVLCYWETAPAALVGPVWIGEQDGRRGYLDRYFDGWLDPQDLRLLDADAVNRLLVAYIDDARAGDYTAALKLLEQA
ncbi:hypothetical protein ONR75_23540 [Rhodopseudomonas sp. P2A-2r]|uniref:hypothetical protein n=1 Tax=Rhodopseudomonas sp. P2A-2r TaxID=2991972 RepID=UPI002234E6B3|nr:hypothetical protein [Rhodopseudomonas sp. P2A-2r]UZE47823.1 hypothetical protein ONR75_23540 [Rhodopseudomonas sp. P2A-2r]